MVKKAKKPGKGKEKTEKKTAKAEEKRARRESAKVSEEDDIDAILLSIQKEEAKKKEVYIEENVPAPSPRSNCSLNINPSKDTEIILYGGEFYNGNKTFVYGDLYRYDIEKREWKVISSPNSPPPRSAHQSVAWKNNLYIFGGEFTSPNQERFHHYKDFWLLDLKTNQWEQLNIKGCPCPRSGHRMVLYKHKVVLFGGFYDTLREVRYFNDLHIFDLDQYKWQEVKPTPGCFWPSARSGFQFFVNQDEIFLYGGYSKEVSADKNSSEKGVVHSDMWTLNPKTWEWDKVKRSGMPPSPRAGSSICVHKRRALFFGGVVDMEMEGDVIMSLFLNELYGFQIDAYRWYPLELRKSKSKDKMKKSLGIDPSVFSGGKETTSEHIKEAAGIKRDIEEITCHLSTDISINGDKCNDVDMTISSNENAPSGLDLKNSFGFEVVKPCGRINSCMVVARDTLYVYGGTMEVRDKEITLDDLYSLNLSKLDEWNCIIPASESEWMEVSDAEDDNEDDDNDAEISSDEEEDEGDDDVTIEARRDDGKSVVVDDAVAIIRGEGKGLRRKEKRARIEHIRATLGLSDSQRTPMPGESLKEFYKRTTSYWQMTAYEHFQHIGKELRKDGFDLAEVRYRELKPILDELTVLEAEQKVDEEQCQDTSQKKRGGQKKNKR